MYHYWGFLGCLIPLYSCLLLWLTGVESSQGGEANAGGRDRGEDEQA